MDEEEVQAIPSRITRKTQIGKRAVQEETSNLADKETSPDAGRSKRVGHEEENAKEDGQAAKKGKMPRGRGRGNAKESEVCRLLSHWAKTH